MIAPKDNPPTFREKIQEYRDTCVQLEAGIEKRIGEAQDPEAKQRQEGRLSDLKNLRAVFEALLDERDEELLGEKWVIEEFIAARRELIRYQADPDRIGPSGKILADLKKREFYEKVQEIHARCKKARDAEMAKSEQGSHLAKLRATELNTYLAIFQSIRDFIRGIGPNACPEEDLREMTEEINATKKRFLRLLNDPQYTGQTGKVETDWATKKNKEPGPQE